MGNFSKVRTSDGKVLWLATADLGSTDLSAYLTTAAAPALIKTTTNALATRLGTLSIRHANAMAVGDRTTSFGVYFNPALGTGITIDAVRSFARVAPNTQNLQFHVKQMDDFGTITTVIPFDTIIVGAHAGSAVGYALDIPYGVSLFAECVQADGGAARDYGLQFSYSIKP